MKQILLFAIFVLALSAPLEPANDPYNVNRNPGQDSTKFFGRWENHTYFPSPSDWRQVPIYQLVTDRFADGNPTNNEGHFGGYNLYKVDMRHGGDFLGLVKKLDYIKSLGFMGVWISPIFQNMENSYHGYAQIDFTVLDDRFGTLDELRKLTSEAHNRGMYIIVDIVVNHMADLFYFEGHEREGAPFRFHDGEYRIFPRYPSNNATTLFKSTPNGLFYRDFNIDNNWDGSAQYGTVYNDQGYAVTDSGHGSFSGSDFHHNGDLRDYGDVWQNHVGKIYGVMDDLRTEHPRVQQKLIAMTNALIASADIDGIRMDTPMQNPLSFFQAWAPAVRNYAKSLGKDNFFIYGEFFCTMNRAATMVGRGKSPNHYGHDVFIGNQWVMDGGIHYPMYWWFQSAIINQQSGHLNDFFTMYQNIPNMFDFYVMHKNYEWRYQQLHFYNNHDQWRMSASTDGFAKTDMSSAIISFFPGIPLFYSGDEQGFLTYGTALDGWSREDHMTSLAWRDLKTVDNRNPCDNDNFNMTNPHYLWVQLLNNIRRQYPELSTCDKVVERWTQPNNNNGIFAFSRGYCNSNQSVLVMFNTWKDSLFVGPPLGAFISGFQEGQIMTNILSDSEEIYKVGPGGAILSQIWLSGYEVKAFVVDSYRKPLNPVVKRIYPPHDSKFPPNLAPMKIVLEFSEDMMMNSDMLLGLRIDGQTVPASDVTYDPQYRALIYTGFSATRFAEGIHTIEFAPSSRVTSKASMPMFAPFKSRFLIGKEDNILLRPVDAKVDSSLFSWVDQSQGLVQLNHKAAGAEQFRYLVGGTWSAWQPYQAQTRHTVPTDTTKITVQYYADGSAAYYVSNLL